MSDETREAVAQWLRRAETDWRTVQILLASSGSPAESICFHCQQYAEKLLKAVLTLHQVEAPRTHDLRRLLELADPFVPGLMALADAADRLTTHAVEMRYPEDWRQIDATEMQEMVALARTLAACLLPILAP